MRLAVLGAGAWGTALAAHFAREGHDVVLWGRDAARLQEIAARRENSRYLPGIALPAALRVETGMAAALAGAELILVVTPLAGLRPTLERVAALDGGVPVIWACKGLEAESGKLPHRIVAEALGESRPRAALSGPSFAAEVARGLPAAVTLASEDEAFVRDLAQKLNSPRLRLYANGDLTGVEVCGAVKNVLAIATGICDGMGFGLNARAALITRGLAEIGRLVVAQGGRRETVLGLAGVGDVILTCTGDLSRNRRVGLALAGGKHLPDILRELGQAAEGVHTAFEVAALAIRIGVDMPITQTVSDILHDGLPPAEAVERLLSRDPKSE